MLIPMTSLLLVFFILIVPFVVILFIIKSTNIRRGNRKFKKTYRIFG